jgi:hypothetical protein
LDPAASAGFRVGDLITKDIVYSLPLREWYFLSERVPLHGSACKRDPSGGKVPKEIFCAIASGEGDSVTQALGIVISIPPVKSRGKASKSRNLFVPPCYVHRDRAMLGLVDILSSLTHPFPFPRGRGRGMEFGPTTGCVDLADHMGLSKSRNLSVPPCYVHRDRAMLGCCHALRNFTPSGRARF